jgi:hypothetical protein
VVDGDVVLLADVVVTVDVEASDFGLPLLFGLALSLRALE